MQSSNLKAVRYANETLEIMFKEGHVYRYLNVSQQIFDKLMSSASKGRFFKDFILRQYKNTKIVKCINCNKELEIELTTKSGLGYKCIKDCY